MLIGFDQHVQDYPASTQHFHQADGTKFFHSSVCDEAKKCRLCLQRVLCARQACRVQYMFRKSSQLASMPFCCLNLFPNTLHFPLAHAPSPMQFHNPGDLVHCPPCPGPQGPGGAWAVHATCGERLAHSRGPAYLMPQRLGAPFKEYPWTQHGLRHERTHAHAPNYHQPCARVDLFASMQRDTLIVWHGVHVRKGLMGR